MLDDGPRNVTRKDFVSYAKVRQSYKNANIVLEAIYAKGIKCKINGLVKSPELNGKIGICNGTIQKSRIGVQLEGSEKDFAIKPANLQIINVGKKIWYNCDNIRNDYFIVQKFIKIYNLLIQSSFNLYQKFGAKSLKNYVLSRN